MDTTQMKEYAVFASIAAPVLLGLLQVLKKVFPKTSKYLPLIGLVIGLLLSFLVSGALQLSLNVYLLILFGIMLGLTPTGLYEVVKNATNRPIEQDIE